MTISQKLVILSSAVLALSTGAHANLLANGDFALPYLGASASYTGFLAGPAAASDFESFNNYGGTTYTEIVTPPPGLPTGTATALLFESTAQNSEIDQEFLVPPTGGPATGSAWVFLLRGGVGLGVGNGGAVGYDDYTTVTREWIYLSYYFDGPTNNFIVGTSSTDGAEFYVANANVTASTPGPVAVAPFLLGLAGVRRRRSKQVS